MVKVAIITRTRDRALLLDRCLLSISRQTFRDFQWVIINDAGDKNPVDGVAQRAQQLGIDVQVLNRLKSTGMEAASNEGIAASTSTFIAIHDDDDTWHPDFLSRTIDLLSQQPDTGGVVTHAWRILERISDDKIHLIKKEFHKPYLSAIQIADMVRSNLFPPIAFVYRRNIYDVLGGYDENMKVFGDWDFNLRFLLCTNIAVIPECLASYHVRANFHSVSAPINNSLQPGSSLQQIMDAEYRNRMIRKDVKDGVVGLGVLLLLGQIANGTRPTGLLRFRLLKIRRMLSALRGFD